MERTSVPANSGKYASVNDLDIYYETHGKGDPLILVPGGFGSTGMFDEIIQSLSAERQVIVFDQQGHGRTALTERPMSFDALASDIVGLIKHLGFEKADLMGFSFGGIVALHTALKYPETISRLIVLSAPFKRTGLQQNTIDGFDDAGAFDPEVLKQAPIYAPYMALAPKSQEWPSFVKQMGVLLHENYDWSKEVANTKIPMMIIIGDADIVKPTHAVEFFELLGGGKEASGWDGSGMSKSSLCILPRMTHYQISSSAGIATAVNHFLT